ncbi:MAG: hypothetical protein AAFR16_01535, partial [Pseudomonadota bacterium]
MFQAVRTVFAATFTAALLVFAAAPDARANQQSEAKALAEQMIDDTYAVLSDGGLGEGEKFSRVHAVMSKLYDIETFDRRLLGSKTRAKLSDAEQAEFAKLLPRFLTSLFKENFSRDLSRKAEVGEAKDFKGKGSTVAVSLPRTEGRMLPFFLYVNPENKIIDGATE